MADMESWMEADQPVARPGSEPDRDEGTGRDGPHVTFFRLVPGCRLPQRADRAAAGTMPTRAFRYCEAMTAASAYGWYVFPPISFSLIWDGGSDIIWSYQGVDDWYSLKIAQVPNFADHFDRVAPPEFKGFSPPFLAAFKEPGVVQIWTGLIARTQPGWSLLVRSPANLTRSQNYDHYEGIIETDRWFGPLFTNVRLTRTHAPIEFDAEFPFVQVQPIPRIAYGDGLDGFDVVEELGEFQADDWESFRSTVVAPNVDPHRQRGQYAVGARRRRKSDVATD
jgi:Family of unknown function (DUF6065)